MATRAREFEEVRRLLRNPKHQQPSPDLIVSQLIRQEQSMANKLNGTGKAWTTDTVSVTSVVDTAEYDITLSTASYTFGKALFVYRDLGDGNIMPVPVTDYNQELANQSHQFILSPVIADQTTGVYMNSEKVAFFRNSASEQKMRIYPVPAEVRTYVITYAVGELDWDEFDLTDTPLMPEWSNLRTLQTALFLLPSTDWDGLDFQQNSQRRNELSMSISAQLATEAQEFNAYIRNPHHSVIQDSGEWWDE